MVQNISDFLQATEAKLEHAERGVEELQAALEAAQQDAVEAATSAAQADKELRAQQSMSVQHQRLFRQVTTARIMQAVARAPTPNRSPPCCRRHLGGMCCHSEQEHPAAPSCCHKDSPRREHSQAVLTDRQEAEEHNRAMSALESALEDARALARSREQKLLIATKELKASRVTIHLLT